MEFFNPQYIVKVSLIKASETVVSTPQIMGNPIPTLVKNKDMVKIHFRNEVLDPKVIKFDNYTEAKECATSLITKLKLIQI